MKERIMENGTSYKINETQLNRNTQYKIFIVASLTIRWSDSLHEIFTHKAVKKKKLLKSVVILFSPL